jgi:uncharacterized protein YjiS (DUF1127 family)
MSTILHRSSPVAAGIAAVSATMLAAQRTLHRLAPRVRRRRLEPLAGLSEHVLRDIGLSRCGLMPFRRHAHRDWSDPRV